MQALYDSGSSRKKGVLGVEKTITLIKRRIVNISHVKNIQDLMKSSVAYFLPDKGDGTLFEKFCESLNIKYAFGKNHHGKKPDLVFKINGRFFIIEAKHIKESGGAQDKQIGEMIEFVRYSEDLDNIHYMAFMDGMYFNNFIWVKDETKIGKQKETIEKYLHKNKKNFFVNTAGFLSLLEDLVEEINK